MTSRVGANLSGASSRTEEGPLGATEANKKTRKRPRKLRRNQRKPACAFSASFVGGHQIGAHDASRRPARRPARPRPVARPSRPRRRTRLGPRGGLPPPGRSHRPAPSRQGPFEVEVAEPQQLWARPQGRSRRSSRPGQTRRPAPRASLRSCRGAGTRETRGGASCASHPPSPRARRRP